MRIILALIFLFLMISSCNKKEEFSHPYTFYYWKTTLKLDAIEQKALKNSTNKILYVRLFDVDKISGKFKPVATATKTESFQPNKSIVPVIFITNRTFLDIESNEIEFLAKSVYTLIQKKIIQFGLSTPNEIQIDCDWTSKTKQDYFKFLTLLKKEANTTITSTLRLHQVKDKDSAGIPPVNKVYLMCYSTSSPLENSDRNSILDLNLLKTYLTDLGDYPIQDIRVALPIYSWGIVENHLGKHKLINALNKADLNNPNFKKISDSEAEILKDGFYFGFFLNKGFTVKIEEITPQKLKETVTFLEDKIQSFPIVYYQLDSKFVKDRSLNHSNE